MAGPDRVALFGSFPHIRIAANTSQICLLKIRSWTCFCCQALQDGSLSHELDPSIMVLTEGLMWMIACNSRFTVIQIEWENVHNTAESSEINSPWVFHVILVCYCLDLLSEVRKGNWVVVPLGRKGTFVSVRSIPLSGQQSLLRYLSRKSK